MYPPQEVFYSGVSTLRGVLQRGAHIKRGFTVCTFRGVLQWRIHFKRGYRRAPTLNDFYGGLPTFKGFRVMY